MDDNPCDRGINNWIIARQLITIHLQCFVPLTETYKAPVIATKQIFITKSMKLIFGHLHSHCQNIKYTQCDQIHTMSCCQNMSLANEHTTAMTFTSIVCNEDGLINLQWTLKPMRPNYLEVYGKFARTTESLLQPSNFSDRMVQHLHRIFRLAHVHDAPLLGLRQI